MLGDAGAIIAAAAIDPDHSKRFGTLPITLGMVETLSRRSITSTAATTSDRYGRRDRVRRRRRRHDQHGS